VLRARITTLLVVMLTLRKRIITKTSLIYTKERRFAITKSKRCLFLVRLTLKSLRRGLRLVTTL
jgi:hypothetical protein